MTDTVIRLGDFAFQGFEVPEKIPFGGEQMLATHKFIGGKRVIDAMGADDIPLTWSGRFRAAGALDRALILDRMRRSGRKWTLTWGGLAYTVVIQRFVADYESRLEMPYEITCEVQNYDVDPVRDQRGIGVDDMVASDRLMADGLVAEIAVPALSSQMGEVDVSLSGMSNIAASSRSTLNAAMLPIAATQTTVQELQELTDAEISQFGDLGALTVGVPVSTLISRLQGQIAGMAQSARLYETEAYLGRINLNLEAVGVSGAEQLMVGGNLYALALGAYGDATEWSTIAQANGILDPFLTGVQTLLVPPSPALLGGVPNV